MKRKWSNTHEMEPKAGSTLPASDVPSRIAAHGEQALVNREMNRLGRWGAYVGMTGAVPFTLGLGITVTQPPEDVPAIVHTIIPASEALGTMGTAVIIGAAIGADRKRERRLSRDLQHEHITQPRDDQPAYVLPNGAQYIPPEKEGGQWRYVVAAKDPSDPAMPEINSGPSR